VAEDAADVSEGGLALLPGRNGAALRDSLKSEPVVDADDRLEVDIWESCLSLSGSDEVAVSRLTLFNAEVIPPMISGSRGPILTGARGLLERYDALCTGGLREFMVTFPPRSQAPDEDASASSLAA